VGRLVEFEVMALADAAPAAVGDGTRDAAGATGAADVAAASGAAVVWARALASRKRWHRAGLWLRAVRVTRDATFGADAALTVGLDASQAVACRRTR